MILPRKSVELRVSAALIVLLAFVSHGTAQGQLARDAFEGTGYRPLLDSSGVPAAEVEGSWRSRGYGYRLEIGAGGTALVCETTNFAYLALGPGEAMEDPVFYAPESGGAAIRILAHPDEIPIVLDRVEGGGTPRLAPDPERPGDMFELFSETVREHYAFFDLWDVDWTERVRKGRSELASLESESELFELFASMLSGIDDGHLTLTAELPSGRRHLSKSEGPTRDRLRELFAGQDEHRDFDSYEEAWSEAYLRAIDRALVPGSARTTAAGTLRYGWLDDRVAYLNVLGMEGPDPGDLFDRVERLQRGLDQVLEEFESSKALVLDVTRNRGGRDAFTVALANRFADERRLAFEKPPVAPGDLHFERFVEPSDRSRYLQPVVVLTSDLTISAAESFVLCMRVLPHVTIAGDRTAGAFSDMLEKPLPNGFHLTLSNQRYVDDEGVCHEGRGIPPDVPIPVFDPADPWTGHVSALRAAARLAARGE